MLAICMISTQVGIDNPLFLTADRNSTRFFDLSSSSRLPKRILSRTSSSLCRRSMLLISLDNTLKSLIFSTFYTNFLELFKNNSCLERQTEIFELFPITI